MEYADSNTANQSPDALEAAGEVEARKTEDERKAKECAKIDQKIEHLRNALQATAKI